MTRGNTALSVILLIGLVFSIAYSVQTSNQIRDLSSRVETLNSQVSELRPQVTQTTLPPPTINRTDQGQLPSATPAGIYEAVKNSVVSIRVLVQSDLGLAEAQGSGFIVNREGHIVTNFHVIQNAMKIEVIFLDGSTFAASAVGTDLFSDLAVVKVQAPASQLQPVPLGDSSQLRVGEPILAIGNPFGLSGSLTTGVVSRLHGTLQAAATRYSIPDVIQIDAAINPGNSGGPLLNYNGEVVGITTAIQTEGVGPGVGFAVPSNTVRRELPFLIQLGKYDHPWLGVSLDDVTSGIAQAMNLPFAKGVLVVEVTAGGPAERAGLRGGTRQAVVDGRQKSLGGDVILSINEVTIRNVDDLSSYLEGNTRPGQTIVVRVFRAGTEITLSVTLGIRPLP